MTTKPNEISNFAALKIAVKGETAFTVTDWIESQTLRAARIHYGVCNRLAGRAPFTEYMTGLHTETDIGYTQRVSMAANGMLDGVCDRCVNERDAEGCERQCIIDDLKNIFA